MDGLVSFKGISAGNAGIVITDDPSNGAIKVSLNADPLLQGANTLDQNTSIDTARGIHDFCLLREHRRDRWGSATVTVRAIS